MHEQMYGSQDNFSTNAGSVNNSLDLKRGKTAGTTTHIGPNGTH